MRLYVGIKIPIPFLILKGKAPDFALQPKDIVYVPPRMFTSLRDVIRGGIRDFVGSIGSNAGTSAYIAINPEAAGETAPTTSLDFQGN